MPVEFPSDRYQRLCFVSFLWVYEAATVFLQLFPDFPAQRAKISSSLTSSRILSRLCPPPQFLPGICDTNHISLTTRFIQGLLETRKFKSECSTENDVAIKLLLIQTRKKPLRVWSVNLGKKLKIILNFVKIY